jgi:regulator of protease activity HflC (stomatin/prohibitin superfamily)
LSKRHETVFFFFFFFFWEISSSKKKKKKKKKKKTDYVQPGEVMFKYKRRFVTIEFKGDTAISCFTLDGLNAVLTLSAQYQLLREELVETLNEFGREAAIVKYITAITRDSVRRVCGSFSGEEMFTARGQIESSLLSTLKSDFLEASVHAAAGFIQLENIALPIGFENAINDKQVAEQETVKAENERKGRLVEAETELRLADREATIAAIDAEAKASGEVSIARQTAAGISKTWSERATAYKQIMDSMGLSAEDFVRGYLTTIAVQGTAGAVIGVD